MEVLQDTCVAWLKHLVDSSWTLGVWCGIIIGLECGKTISVDKTGISVDKTGISVDKAGYVYFSRCDGGNLMEIVLLQLSMNT